MQLLTQQNKAIDKLHRLKVGALFMEPGTGKTRTAYELVKSVKSDYIFWLTPFQTKQNLQDEINKCGGFSNSRH
jgi:predicted helicase